MKKQKSKLSGATAALMDEYKRAMNDLIAVIKPINNKHLIAIVDLKTNDPDCKSIQTILTHVIASGYIYTLEIEKHQGIEKPYPKKIRYSSVNEYIIQLSKMFDYCNNFFEENSSIKIVEKNNSKKIKVRWGQSYDIDQLLEHAIVHVLRHRRQIENFITKLNS